MSIQFLYTEGFEDLYRGGLIDEISESISERQTRMHGRIPFKYIKTLSPIYIYYPRPYYP